MPRRHRVSSDEGNKRSHLTTVHTVVRDPQFRSGYRDRLAGLPPKRFFYDEAAGRKVDTWGYERGRLVACWMLAKGRQPPAATNVEALVRAYQRAEAEGVVL